MSDYSDGGESLTLFSEQDASSEDDNEHNEFGGDQPEYMKLVSIIYNKS